MLSYSSFNLLNSIHSVVHTKFVCCDKWKCFFLLLLHFIQKCHDSYSYSRILSVHLAESQNWNIKQNMNPFLFFKNEKKKAKKKQEQPFRVSHYFFYCDYLYTLDLPKSNSFTSDAALSPSARNALSIFFDLSIASLSLDALTAQPILKC